MVKLLLVEDDLTMMGLLKTLFQLEGYQVVRFDGVSPDDLINLLRREKPDILMLDVILRHFNGLEFINLMHQQPEFDQLHVIMTSGMDLRDQCLKAGATAFILKPFNPDELLNKIKDLLPD